MRTKMFPFTAFWILNRGVFVLSGGFFLPCLTEQYEASHMIDLSLPIRE